MDTDTSTKSRWAGIQVKQIHDTPERRRSIYTEAMHLKMESGQEIGWLTVAKYDLDRIEWTSKRLGRDRHDPRYFNPTPRDFAEFNVHPYEVTRGEGHNVITTAGWNRILVLVTGSAATTFASATCRIGVGTATATGTSGDTDLAGTTSAGRWWQRVGADGTTAQGTAVRQLSLSAAVTGSNAAFAWAEWGIDQGAANGSGAVVAPLLNRAASAQGTKGTGTATWTATATLDFL